MIDKLKPAAIPLLIFILSLVVIYYLTPEYHPFGGVKISKSENVIREKGKEYFKISKIKVDNEKLRVEFIANEPLIRWINSKYPLNKSNQVLRDNGTAFYWQLSQPSNDTLLIITSNSSKTTVKKNENVNLKLTEDGKLFSLIRQIKDSLELKSLTSDEAKNVAMDFIHLLRNDILFFDDSTLFKTAISDDKFLYKATESFQKNNRTDYKIIWQAKNKFGFEKLLTANLICDKVESFNIEMIVPEEFKDSSPDIFEIATLIIFILLIIISIIVVGFKRFRAFEIGFKHAIIFGILVLISFVTAQILEQYYFLDYKILLGLVFGGIFICGAAIILWSVSETVFREIWNRKFLSLDLIFHKKFTHSIVGKAILNSISFGLGLTALFLILLRVISEGINVSFTGEFFRSQSHLTAFASPLNILFGVFNSYAILAVAFFMFLTAVVKRFINDDTIFVLVSGIVWAILIQSNISPLTAGLPINLIFGILLSFILIKYDLLTAITSYLLFQFFIKASEFAFLQEQGFKNQWYLIIGLSLAGILLGIIFMFKKDKFTDYDSITPKYIENVTERQRLKRELDVARRVQMSFLPKGNPEIKGLDIASICIPAFEVGGDYYDFIYLDENKIGIIIGDVSGKGTQAAFYMTLTKGFLKAIAKQTDSPSEVLSRMNELFYENVERGRFISMIYAIVDLQNKVIKIARAGHNPVILHNVSGKVNLINPKGLALGLEKGPLFRKVISEFEEKLEPGKNFIFYTDGFTEAANKKDEEYGLDRLTEIAKLNYQNSSQEIMDKIIQDVQKFIGKAKQHDDMTMVIVKVN